MNEANPSPVDALLREEAWRHHRSWLKRLAASLVVDAARADDLTQQALLTALERPPADATHPRAWLAAVARNLARRFALGDRRRVAREQVAAVTERLPATDEVVARAALQIEVSLAVLALEEPYRSVLLLRFFEDLPPRTIATRLGIPVATARTRILRGIEQLRTRLITQRGANADCRGPALGALGLIALLDGTARRAVRRALLAKSATGSAAIVSGSAVATWGLLGVLGMSTKLKLAAAAITLAVGTFAVVKLCEIPASPPRDAAASATRGPSPLPAPATVDAPLPQPARADATRTPEAGDAATRTSEEKTTPTTGAVEGTVRTARGDPAAGALVLLEDALRMARCGSLLELCAGAEELLKGGDANEESARGALRTISGSDGRFRFEGAALGRSVNVAAIHRDEGMALVTGRRIDGSSADRCLELVLSAGVVLHGDITGEQGEPIAGVKVDVVRLSRSETSSSSTSLLAVAADAQGHYRTLPLPFDGFRLSVHATGWFSASEEAIPILAGERERRVDLRLARAPTWRGRVLAGDGTPAHLAGVASPLAVVASSLDPGKESFTPESGGDRGTLVLAEDRYEVTPERTDRRYVSLWSGGVLLGFAEVAPSGVAPDLIVDLARLPQPKAVGSLVIVVVDARNGTPIPSYQFHLTGDPLTLEEPNASDLSRPVADPEGRIALDALVAGSYDVTVRAEGFTPLLANLRVVGRPPTSPAAPDAPVRLALKPADARVEGRIEDENGQPLADVAVYLQNGDGTAALPYPEHRLLSDAEGRFVFQGVAEGDYLVVAARNEFAPPVPAADEFAPACAAAKASSGLTSDLERVVLRVGRGVVVAFEIRCDGTAVSGPFSFRIRDEQGTPIHDHHRPGMLTEMSGGGFKFRLVPGNYTVEVFSPKFAPNRTKFRAVPDGTVVVDLQPIATPRSAR